MWVVVVVLLLAWLGCLYVFVGGTKLWGSHRGVPFCGHPFELTWGTGVKSWKCPKCRTQFEVRDGRWVPLKGRT